MQWVASESMFVRPSMGFSHSVSFKISITWHIGIGKLKKLKALLSILSFPVCLYSKVKSGEELDRIQFNAVTKWITTTQGIHHWLRGDHRWSVNHYILITHVLQVSDFMSECRKKSGQDSWSLNSSLIDFNGELLISVQPRSAGTGQSHLLDDAGHPVC